MTDTATAHEEWTQWTRFTPSGDTEPQVTIQPETANSLAYIFDQCLRVSQLMRNEGVTIDEGGIVMLSHLHKTVQKAVDQLTARKLEDAEPDVVEMFRRLASVEHDAAPSDEDVKRVAFDLLLYAMKYLACVTDDPNAWIVYRAEDHKANVRELVADKVAELRTREPDDDRSVTLIAELKDLIGDLSTDGDGHTPTV